ncbi:MAG: GNAT family N-acetyltransferase [Pseudomonadales bacterium]
MTAAIIQIAISELAKARATNSRGLMVLTGSKGWVSLQAQAVYTELGHSSLWLGEATSGVDSTIVASKARSLLGSEYQLVVIDAFSGLHPDALAAITGTVTGGGLLVLLSPPLNQWEAFDDPDYARLAIHGHEISHHFFLKRIAKLLLDSPFPAIIEEDKELPSSEPVTLAAVEKPPFSITHCQKKALDAIEKVVNGHRKRPLVITADRGRGKSTALGIASASLMAEATVEIIICASHVSSVEPVFEHAQRILGDAQRVANVLSFNQSRLVFMPPDELLRRNPKATLLLVDEAAAIPVSMLGSMVRRYPRIVYSTTVHGYEGHGRGFTVKFQALLDQVTPQWKSVEMTEPVRWSSKDKLEPLLTDLLLLASEPAEITTSDVPSISYRLISQETLLERPDWLSQIFGLLVHAHYRTSPDDLRILLDGPNIKLLIALQDERVVGSVLIAAEGGLEDELVRPVAMGSRRVAGHLVPQIMASQAGVLEMLGQTVWRIVRIAVHPQCRRQGVGIQLLANVEKQAKMEYVDCVASSFAMSSDLLDFWHRAGLIPLHIGTRRDSVSGAYAVVVGKALNDAAGSVLLNAREKLQRSFAYRLQSHLSEVDPLTIISLAQRLPVTDTPSPEDYRDLAAFVFGNRLYESVASVMATILQFHLTDEAWCEALPSVELELMVARVLQQKSVRDCASLYSLSGRVAVEKTIKNSLATLVEIKHEMV